MRPGWRRLFDKLGGFFTETFGPEWQKKEKKFWDQVVSGKYDHKPVIIKK